MADLIRVNGKVFDWGSCILKIGGVRYEGVTSIKYDQKRDRAKVYGMGRDRAPLGRTGGKYEAGDCTMAMYRSTAQSLRDWAALRAGDGLSYGDAEFPIVVQMVETGLAPITDELLKACIISDAGGGEENPDPLKEDVVFQVLKMKRNGKTLWSQRKF